ncbi:XRE family transcriptional regulator [Mycobacterium eburneum]|nr:helix-turn-helix transcriptional regulator [Mycobacterium eburneum]TDH57519.1 XRE family transcriptional regulator [Mycobacterium eburneum]
MKLRSAELLRAFVGPQPEKKMSARQLARSVDTHNSFIDHLLSGRRSSCLPVTADRIAQALGVPTDVLFEERVPSAERAIAKSKATPAA